MHIRLTNVTVHIPGRNIPLFHIPSFEIGHGEKVLIQGPSGTGKTTLLHLIAGLFSPSDGTVLIRDQNLRFLSDNQRCRLRRSEIGLVFQSLNLLDHLTALENVELLLSGKSRREKALQALEKMNLKTVQSSLSAKLSLGEKQRVAVARIVAHEPSLVLADEPTSSLDDKNASTVIESLLGLPKKPTFMVVSHDHRLKEHFSNVIDFNRWIKA